MSAASVEKCKNRLQGLNLFRVCGKPSVNRDVLASTLKVFDSDIFNDDSINAFLNAAGADRGGSISLAALSVYLGSPLPPGMYPTPCGTPMDPASAAKLLQRGSTASSGCGSDWDAIRATSDVVKHESPVAAARFDSLMHEGDDLRATRAALLRENEALRNELDSAPVPRREGGAEILQLS
eukprot:TRINITY_DN32297_c0_g1_i2.p1 TRINITY_DN32297_c0_g1~~TRINITY_DN32297_c0_g1_i2.p1  ORF type:complete len:181 (-),score=32.30 TRINITY_DN32297_c0_g1_i2:124-666(-)